MDKKKPAPAKKPLPNPADFRRGGMHTLGMLVPKAASPILRKRGFAQAAIVARWAEIVGPELAKQSLPEKLSFPRESSAGGATLHVRAAGAMALELQHLSSIVLERVNGFFGYQAVEKLTLVQAPLPKREVRVPKKPARPLTAEEVQGLDAAVAALPDGGLKDALRILGQRVAESASAPALPLGGRKAGSG